MEMKTYRFAIIGTGAIANIHAQAIQEIDNAVLIGAYNRTPEKAAVFAQKWNCQLYPTLEELLAEELDVICICTASGLHLPAALQSIQAAKHVLIEKPLEITAERCEQIAQAAIQQGVKVGVIFPSRFNSSSQRIKQALQANRFGKLVMGSAYVKWSRDAAYYASAPWRGTWEFDGGGALMNQAIHSVDLLQWYMGPVKSVQAIAANIRHKDIEVEDTVVAIIRFESGALGSIECTTATFPGSFKRVEIHGTQGTAVLEENTIKSWQFTDETAQDKQIQNQTNNQSTQGGFADPMDIAYLGHKHQIVDFLTAIANSTTPLVDAAEGKKSVEIIEAIYKSAKTGMEVFLKPEEAI